MLTLVPAFCLCSTQCNRIWPCIRCQKHDDLMRREFTKSNTSSCHFIERESNAARKTRRRNISATSQTNLRIGEESGSAVVTQEASRTHRHDNDHDFDSDSDNDSHDHPAENSATVHSDDLNSLANQRLDEQLAAFGVGAQVKPLLSFLWTGRRDLILTRNCSHRRIGHCSKGDMTNSIPYQFQPALCSRRPWKRSLREEIIRVCLGFRESRFSL
jgi:hypothetical protein